MSTDYYKLSNDAEILYFEFFSEGPKGQIKKIIHFQEFVPGSQIYNLGFGDWNPEKNDVDDMAVTNNRDTLKVLGTVAKAVEEFMLVRPGATVFAQGSTAARTRLYQMGVSTFFDRINKSYLIFGLYNKTGCNLKKG